MLERSRRTGGATNKYFSTLKRTVARTGRAGEPGGTPARTGRAGTPERTPAGRNAGPRGQSPNPSPPLDSFAICKGARRCQRCETDFKTITVTILFILYIATKRLFIILY